MGAKRGSRCSCVRRRCEATRLVMSADCVGCLLMVDWLTPHLKHWIRNNAKAGQLRLSLSPKSNGDGLTTGTGTVTRLTLSPDFKRARDIATLVRKDISFVEKTTLTYKQGLKPQLVEIFSSRASKANIFLLNVYSPPRDRLRNFNSFFLVATKQAKNKPLMIAGEFNAHSKSWGYSIS
ncbi:hypothetical protein HPB51_020889 [Rhipicephalus microplus]|uniref:Endonuclease/exonuclease/phosphatase domain-containing protein n=1 Tax=Rhipicephalus microplus TaxID=6941 RepID=A0A9J6EUZ6_RHIMP|nr:hypothetical protein HPB51_020889 [Rhipicephalus microplus]